MKKIKVLQTGIAPISQLKEWADNPRIIFAQDVERLVAQIKELGVYKPILVTPDGLVLGGHARLRALQQAGETRAWVSIVDAQTHEERLFIALSDNDNAGTTNEDKLMRLIGRSSPAIFADYIVDLGQARSLSELMETAGIGNVASSDEMPTIGKMILPFSNEDYERVLDVLDKVMEREGVGDHTEAVIFLLEKYD